MKQSDSDIVCDFFTWHAGGGSYVLTDEYNNVSLEKKKIFIIQRLRNDSKIWQF